MYAYIGKISIVILIIDRVILLMRKLAQLCSDVVSYVHSYVFCLNFVRVNFLLFRF